MAHPKEAINAALKTAMKNKDTQRRNTLRLLSSALKQVEIDKQTELSAEDAHAILQKEAKTRRENAEEMAKAGREDLADQDRYELAVIEEFLPRQMTREEIAEIAKQVIAEVGAQTPKDMGKVMGTLQPQVKGRADGKLVSQVVQELLSE
jgi:uncharacterized protein